MEKFVLFLVFFLILLYDVNNYILSVEICIKWEKGFVGYL